MQNQRRPSKYTPYELIVDSCRYGCYADYATAEHIGECTGKYYEIRKEDKIVGEQ